MADQFDELIAALDAGSCGWISAPTRIGNEMLITAGYMDAKSYRFGFTNTRVEALVAAVERSGVRQPQPSEGA
jgi:hypothetical protein